MDFCAELNTLEHRLAAAKTAAQAATRESRDELKQHIHKASAELNETAKRAEKNARKAEVSAEHEAGTAEATAKSESARMKADSNAGMADVTARIDKRARLDAKEADTDVKWAES